MMSHLPYATGQDTRYIEQLGTNKLMIVQENDTFGSLVPSAVCGRSNDAF